MKTLRLICMFGLIVMIGWSCSTSTSPNEWTSTYEPYESAKMVAPADSSIGLANNIPGFGGWFINKSDQLAIYLTNPDQQKAKAKKVLSNSEFVKKALSNISASVSNMIFKKGSYTFVELYDWRKQVSGKVLPIIDGNYTIGIDQSRNKLYIGVESKAVRDRVHNKLTQLNIPSDAVMIYKVSIWFGPGH